MSEVVVEISRKLDDIQSISNPSGLRHAKLTRRALARLGTSRLCNPLPMPPPFHARPDLSTAARTTDELEAYPDQLCTDSRRNMKPRSVLESGKTSGGLVYKLLVGLSRVGILKAD